MIDQIILVGVKIVGFCVVMVLGAWASFELLWSVFIANWGGLRQVQTAMLFYRKFGWLKEAGPVVAAARQLARVERIEECPAKDGLIDKAMHRLFQAVDEFDGDD